MVVFTKLLVTLVVPLLVSYAFYPLAQRLKMGRDGLLIMAAFLSLLILLMRELYGRTFTFADIAVYVSGVFISIAALRAWFDMNTKWLRASALTEIFSRDYSLPKDIRLRHLLQVAVFIEKEGAAFYDKLAGQTSDAGARKIYEKLSRDEIDHEVTIKRIINQWLSIDDRDNTVSEIYAAAKEKGVFSYPPSFDSGEKESLKYAIDQEKKLLHFYLAFEKAFPEAWKRAHVEQIAMMERSHIEELTTLYENH